MGHLPVLGFLPLPSVLLRFVLEKRLWPGRRAQLFGGSLCLGRGCCAAPCCLEAFLIACPRLIWGRLQQVPVTCGPGTGPALGLRTLNPTATLAPSLGVSRSPEGRVLEMHLTIQSPGPAGAGPWSPVPSPFFSERESSGAPSQVACSPQSGGGPLGSEDEGSDFSVTPGRADMQEGAWIKGV